MNKDKKREDKFFFFFNFNENRKKARIYIKNWLFIAFPQKNI